MRRIASISTFAFLASVSLACASGGAGGPGQGLANGGPYVYVANQEDAAVTVIDIPTLAPVDTVDLRAHGFSANAKPHHVVVEPDGSYWYVSLIGENRVLKFDRSNQLVDQAAFEVPGMLALHPTDNVLYVGRSMSAVNPPRRIGVIDRGTMDADEVEVFFPRPHAIALSRGGEYAYTASLAENRMGVVDIVGGGDLELVDLEGPHHAVVQFAVSPDGGTLVATGEMTGQLLVFDLSDPTSPRLIESVDVGSRPWHPVFTPDGRWVYFGVKGDDAVVVVDTSDWSVERTITGEGIDEPHGSAISPDGRWAFISNQGGAGPATVVVIETSTHEVEAVIPAGSDATGVGAPGGR